MFVNWPELLGTLKRFFNRLGDRNPKLLAASRELAAATCSDGPLDAKPTS